MYFAYMDTGGISYGGSEYYAAGRSKREVYETLYVEWNKRNPLAKWHHRYDYPANAEDLNDTYGVNVVKLSAGQCVVE